MNRRQRCKRALPYLARAPPCDLAPVAVSRQERLESTTDLLAECIAGIAIEVQPVMNKDVEKATRASRCGVMDIADRIASNFLPSSAGLMPSNAVSTHTHLTFSRRHISLPRSMPKPTSCPDGALDSNGA